MPQTPSQQTASALVASWLARNAKNPAWLVDATGADPGTIGDFLNQKRWPKIGTQGKIEKALGWPAGTIRQIGNGGLADKTLIDSQTSAVGGDTQDADFVAAPGPHTTGGISDDEVLRVLDAVQGQIDQLRRRMEGRGSRP